MDARHMDVIALAKKFGDSLCVDSFMDEIQFKGYVMAELSYQGKEVEVPLK